LILKMDNHGPRFYLGEGGGVVYVAQENREGELYIVGVRNSTRSWKKEIDHKVKDGGEATRSTQIEMGNWKQSSAMKRRSGRKM